MSLKYGTKKKIKKATKRNLCFTPRTVSHHISNFSEIEVPCSPTKTKSCNSLIHHTLELDNSNAFSEFTSELKKRLAKKSNESIMPSPIKQYVSELAKEAKSLTNTVDLNNFYTYTKNCFELIPLLCCQSKPLHKKVSIPKEYIDNKLKKLAVFDLDETLFHCDISDPDSCSTTITIKMPSGKSTKIGINFRPYWKEALDRIKKYYTIVVYTASHQSYADSVLNYMDPDNEFFKYRLYRHNCLNISHDGKTFHIKDMTIFEGYSLKDILIIDNSVMSFAFDIDNGIPILPYYDAEKDVELMLCAVYLESIYKCEDVRELNRKYFKLRSYLKESPSSDDSDTSVNIVRRGHYINPEGYSKFKMYWELYIKNCDALEY